MYNVQELAERQLLPGGGRGRGRGKGRGKGKGKGEKTNEGDVEPPSDEQKPDGAAAPEPEPKKRRTKTPKAGQYTRSKEAKPPVPANSMDPSNEPNGEESKSKSVEATQVPADPSNEPTVEEPKRKRLRRMKAAESAHPSAPGTTEVEATPLLAGSKNETPLEDPSTPPGTKSTEKVEKAEHGEGCWNKHGQHQKAKVARRERAQEALQQIRESGIPELVDRVQGDFQRVILICIFFGVCVCACCKKNCLMPLASIFYEYINNYSTACHIRVRSFTAKPTSGPCAGSTHMSINVVLYAMNFYVQNVKVQIGDHKASLFPYIITAI